MNPQVQEKMGLDTVGPSRGPRIEGLEKTCPELAGPKLKGGLRGQLEKCFNAQDKLQPYQIPYPISQFRKKVFSKSYI